MGKTSFALLLIALLALPSLGYAQESVLVGGTTLELLSNTNQCLVDCEAWLEWDLSALPSDILLPPNQNSIFNIQFEKKANSLNLLDYGVEVYSLEKGEWKKAADSLWGFTAKKGSIYRLRVWGKRQPAIGTAGVDWQMTLFGTRVTDWSWWNSDWTSAWTFRIKALADLNAGYPVDVNKELFNFGQCFADANCQADMDDVRVVCHNIEQARHYEDDNSTDFNALWFALPTNLAAGSTYDCNIFFNNPAATYSDTTALHLAAADSKTKAYYRFEENAANNIVYDYSDSNADALAAHNTSTMSVTGDWNRGFDFESAASDYVTFPNPTTPNGTFEFFAKVDGAIGAGGYTLAGITNGAGTQWEISAIVDNVAGECGAAKCWRVGWASSGGSAAWTLNMTGYPLQMDRWYHVAVTWGGTATIYIDNNAWKSGAGGTLGNPGDRPSIGARRRQDIAGYDGYIDAVIDEFRVSNAARTSYYSMYPYATNLANLACVSQLTFETAPYHYLKVKVPKDEETGEGIVDSTRSYSLIIDDGNITYYSGLKNDKMITYNPGDELTVRLVVDENTNTYYSREYFIDFNAAVAGTVTEFQPYLPKQADSADYIFSVVDSTILNPIKGIDISVYGLVPGTGLVEIQNQVTDSTGQVNIPLLLDNSYTVYFRYNNAIVHTATITPTAGSLYYRTALNLVTPAPQTILVPMLKAVFYPKTPYLLAWVTKAAGTAKSLRADFNVSVSLIDFNLTRMVTYVLDTNNCLYDINSFGGAWVDGNAIFYSIDLNTGNATNLLTGLPCKYDFNYNFPLYLRIDANATTDTNYYATSIHWAVINPLSYLEFTLVGGLSKFASTYGAIVTALLSTFITLCACGSIATMGVHDPGLLAIITLGILGVFLFIGWIALLPFLFVAIATIFSIFLVQAVIG